MTTEITTKRLSLRQFHEGDASDVQRLAGERAIADTTLNIPHPYEDGMAEEWIASLGVGAGDGALATFALTLRDGGDLVGAMGFKLDDESSSGDLGYWVGKPHWGNGYATEAAAVLLEYGFDQLGLDTITASHFGRNPASGRVMQKIGMEYSETIEGGVTKWDKPEDLVRYVITKDSWSRSNSP